MSSTWKETRIPGTKTVIHNLVLDDGRVHAHVAVSPCAGHPGQCVDATEALWMVTFAAAFDMDARRPVFKTVEAAKEAAEQMLPTVRQMAMIGCDAGSRRFPMVQGFRDVSQEELDAQEAAAAAKAFGQARS